MKLSEYRVWLHDLKQQIKTGQIKAALSVNSQMIMLYWDLGRQIVDKQEKAQWGSGFIEQLSKDLKEEFPEMKGFSKDNLFMMRRFYLFYTQISENSIVEQPVQQLKNRSHVFVEQVVQQIQVSVNQYNIISEQLVRQFACVPWGHHILILKKIKDINQALFYINKTIENNWSRTVLEYQIETNLHGRQGKAITNFSLTLPELQSDLANQMMKDPYDFGFLRMPENVKEIDLEKALVQHISHFLPELGIGFAYMGAAVFA